MPNHVINEIMFEGEDSRVEALLNRFCTRNGDIWEIDFDKVIEMPESLSNVPQYGESFIAKAMAIYRAHGDTAKILDIFGSIMRLPSKGKLAEMEKYGEQYCNNLQNYGYHSWYNWSIDHWGTKWNAYNHETPVVGNKYTIRFRTAWSAPDPIVMRISETFPDVKVRHLWADEDIGYNLGIKIWEGGIVTDLQTFVEGSKAAVDFAGTLWGDEEDEEETQAGG